MEFIDKIVGWGENKAIGVAIKKNEKEIAELLQSLKTASAEYDKMLASLKVVGDELKKTVANVEKVIENYKN